MYVLVTVGPMAIDEVVGLARQIAEGLAEAHDQGIVHRDVKPPNIFVTSQGRAKILDFGLAKILGDVSGLTKTGSAMGTPSYMSPEQTRGEELDFRTDLWSLGVVLYEMLAGVLPFKGSNVPALIYAIHSHQPEPLQKLRPDVAATRSFSFWPVGRNWSGPGEGVVLKQHQCRSADQRGITAALTTKAKAIEAAQVPLVPIPFFFFQEKGEKGDGEKCEDIMAASTATTALGRFESTGRSNG